MFNWQYNANLMFGDLHNYVAIETIEQAEKLAEFLEWLLPYQHPESVRKLVRYAERRLNRHETVHLHIFGAHFCKTLGYATTMCTSVNEANEVSCRSVINWDDLRHPLFDNSERDDSSLSELNQSILADLKAR